MRVTGAWLDAPRTQVVFSALKADGNVAYAVGGCVRNALLGEEITDVDIATDAPPEVVEVLAARAGLKSVRTGIDHGTITLVSDGVGYEVTTFRADTKTDGRHAEVRFSKDMREDAARRDFTINALYADADGTVYDPLGGLTDLTARCVRFIGDARARIEEDYLRILRFFRFAAWYGDPALGFDTDALAAISESLDGLRGLSKERITSEVIKLLAARNPALAVGAMEHSGVLTTILPGTTGRSLALLVHLEEQNQVPINALRRLAVLGSFDLMELRLPKKSQRTLSLLQGLTSSHLPAAELGYRHGFDAARDTLLLRAALSETPTEPRDFDAAQQGAAAKFPVKPSDLMASYSGAALGDMLRELEDRWVASGFTLKKADLLA